VSGPISVYGANDCGLGIPVSFDIFVSNCAGIQDHSLVSVVTLFPNPVEGKLNIRINGKENELTLQIRDVTGQLIHSETLSGLNGDVTHQVDVTALHNGVYFIRLMNGDRNYTGKFVVQQ
jgi:hypothetical protein